MDVPLGHRSESEARAIREQLDRILKSGPFHQSRRRQRFLEYLINETLAGRGERLKGYSVAVEVFDRPESFDPLVDPVVRIEAARLRDKLREYYEAEGRNDPVRIELPKGTYTPHIEFRQANGPEIAAAHSAEVAPESHAIAATAPAAPTEDASPPASPPSPRRSRWALAIPAAAMIFVAGAAGMWLAREQWQPVPQRQVQDPLRAVANGPLIAVLPFVNLSGDPKQDYFSDGLTEDILTELSRTPDLGVLARNTTFQYKGRAVDVMKLGRELGARYVLEGSVRRTDDRLRVTAQLIDAETGTHIWADRFDREMADVFLVQDEIVSQIVGKIAGGYGVIEKNEANSAARKSPEEIRAYDLVLRARDVMWEWKREYIHSARTMLLEAIALDPTNARARRELAWLTLVSWVFRYDDAPVNPDEIVSGANKAVQLDPADARARMVAASAFFFTGQLDRFNHEAEQAMELAPNDAEIVAILGYMIAISGDWPRGTSLAEKAHALNAKAASGWYEVTMYLNLYLNGEYERALELIRQDPSQQTLYTYVYYISIYGQLGRKEEALEVWRKLLVEEPAWRADSFEKWWRARNMRDEDIAKMRDGVSKSGVLNAAAKSDQ
jgi:TolB-like protein/tetratricopeptide (TPR) repeat protein